MTDHQPKWNRRKDARPAEIIEAAMVEFVERGFAATKLDDVAKRAGVAKGTLYRYFDTKEALFRAVVQQAAELNLENIEQAAQTFSESFKEFISVLLVQAAGKMKAGSIPALARLVLAESRIFPDLARIWHDNIVSRILTLVTAMIIKAQERNEVRAGDPKAYAFSIMGPMVLNVLFREVFDSSSPHIPDYDILAKQHIEILLQGLLNSSETPKL